ncbi:MAG: ribosome recycling factor [Chloroflexota bacterium]
MASQTLFNSQDKMQKTVDGLKKDLLTIRTGRASPSIIEHVKVDYAGVPTPLNQVASISAPEARLLVIQPWDKSLIQNIEKAILSSDLNLTPLNDGALIRINVPPLSEERRQELIKALHRRIEERKIVIRNLRRDAIEDLRVLEKNKEISQEESKRSLNQLQKLTDGFITEVEEIGRRKEAELKEV